MSDNFHSGAGSTGRAVDRVFDLPQRLRAETAALHRAVEEATGLPGSVRDVGEYAAMLERTLRFHEAVMNTLGRRRWMHRWIEVGITLDHHDRTDALRADLAELGSTSRSREAVTLPVDSFDEALGCLYVAEGSSLGGRMLAPLITAQIGPVPLAFFGGEGRAHPIPWRSTQTALRTFEFMGGDCDLVIAGAVTAFEAFRCVVAPEDAVSVDAAPRR